MKLLNSSQAVAAYSAMCCLNTVGGTAHVRFQESPVSTCTHVKEGINGVIQIWVGDRVGDHVSGREEYNNQLEFADAYKV